LPGRGTFDPRCRMPGSDEAYLNPLKKKASRAVDFLRFLMQLDSRSFPPPPPGQRRAKNV
jgi:hypothetical protein